MQALSVHLRDIALLVLRPSILWVHIRHHPFHMGIISGAKGAGGNVEVVCTARCEL